MITGFRFDILGATNLYNAIPDLVTYGKGIANGMPLAAITGKRKHMEKFNDIFYSTTYGGETLSLAASMAVINEIKTKPVIKHCWKLGEELMSKFNKLTNEVDVKIKMEGIPIRSSVICKDANNNPSLLIKSLFYQEMIKRGILLGPGYVFLSYSHSQKDLKKTLEAAEKSLKIVKKAIETKTVKKSLKGKIMKSVMKF